MINVFLQIKSEFIFCVRYRSEEISPIEESKLRQNLKFRQDFPFFQPIPVQPLISVFIFVFIFVFVFVFLLYLCSYWLIVHGQAKRVEPPNSPLSGPPFPPSTSPSRYQPMYRKWAHIEAYYSTHCSTYYSTYCNKYCSTYC